MIGEHLDKIRDGENLSSPEATEAARSILDGSEDDQTIAQFLVALAEKGETGEEIAGFAGELLRQATPVDAPTGAVDLCGTGGGDLPRFNVSTAAAFVVASCGVVVAKHGNRGSRRPNGSFDLLEKLGIPVELPPELVEESLREVGIGFIFARAYHPVMKRVANARQVAGRRTIFNLVGPLANPARVSCQLVGTADVSKTRVLAEALQLLKKERALVVYGEPGVDEFSVSGISSMLEVRPEGIDEKQFTPTEAGITLCDYESLPTGDCEENAEVFRLLLNDEAPEGIRKMVALNSGAVLYLTGAAESIEGGFHRAEAAITDGLFKQKFVEMTSFLNSASVAAEVNRCISGLTNVSSGRVIAGDSVGADDRRR